MEILQYTFTPSILNYMIMYATCNNKLVHISNLEKLSRLVDSVDLSVYDDDEVLSRFSFLKNIVKLKFKDHIMNIDLILDQSKQLTPKYADAFNNIIDDINETFGETGFTDNDIINADTFISDYLKYSSAFRNFPKLEDDYNKLISNQFNNLHDICEVIEDDLAVLVNDFKHIKELSIDNVTDFNSNDDSCINAIANTLNELKSPTNIIKSCITLKNKMLNGGYECGRFYLVLGLQGRGKSRELLQIALDTKNCNPELANINGKKGVILFITQENSIRETLERIWSFYFPNEDITTFTTEEIHERLCKEANFNENAELMIKYRKSKSITTATIDSMIEDIEQNGDKKVVIVIHDYMKRIRSEVKMNSLDNYTELGAIADEFASIAKCRNIPVISAMQFNRQAMTSIQEATKKNKNDVLKNISSADIGESIKIVDNADCIYSILDCTDPVTGEKMQQYNLLKIRSRKSNSEPINYFLHPFEKDNGLRMKNDLGLTTSLSKLSMATDLNNTNAKSLRSISNKNHITDSDRNKTNQLLDSFN